MTSISNPGKAREETDAKLHFERQRSDEELLDRSAALGEDTDELVARARERANAVLEIARRDQDASLLRDGAGDETMATVANERRIDDDTVKAEQATADAAVHHEREKRHRAIMQLLALERTETDLMLGSERSIADRMVAARDDVLGVVSHDLRAQLQLLLLNAAGIIFENSKDVRLVRHADVMQRTVAQMSKLVDDLLDVASMDAGRIRVERISTDLVAVVAEELDINRAAAEARSIQLSLDTSDRSIVAEVDPMRIGRVVMNLLTNAIKFTPVGGHVAVQLNRDGDDVELSVRDTGPGIPPDLLDAVFERFRQIGTEGRRTGYGLGLYIARAIVTAHDGRIWAESTNGQGATFRIRLPGKRA